ncbi:DUF6869 domain-containing protein [Permianibacter aggregans]|nr:hypothetical protein [Permianibacter aggregans]QGX40178.1 hypothetical protein E2H98_11045 [Permianibacter aggregans]
MTNNIDSPDFVAAYVRSLYAASVAERFDTQDSWASDAVTLIAFDDPQKLISIVLRVLDTDPPDEILPVLAAGPLEDYLCHCGIDAIENLERLVENNAQLRNLLGGVWKNSMSDLVWERVQKIWDRTGWDGN